MSQNKPALTVHFTDPRGHEQNHQGHHQAAVHGESFPRVRNLAQVFDGQNALVRHCGQTQDGVTRRLPWDRRGVLTWVLLVMGSDVPTAAPGVLEAEV